ncbi:MAG TPA: prepilin-type N-terminal cleavage/methylation domain-containing protein [Thermoanaerobaculia bacterium]|jgi:prepilin-type N-terminal cleavage/methylation domain-containing protein
MEVRPGQRGFSVVEVLVAAAIFLIIAVGILPLFTQAMYANMAGRDATEVSNAGRSQAEEMLNVPYEALQVPAGKFEGVTEDYWSKSADGWQAGPAPTAGYGYASDVLWVRITRVRQYSRQDLVDDGFANAPLVGGTPADQVFFKEIEVEVRSNRPTLVGGGKSLRLKVLRAV